LYWREIAPPVKQSPFEFYETQASLFKGGLDIAIAAKNTQLAAFNAGQVFKCRVMQGLTSWRTGHNPRGPLEKALDAILSVLKEGTLTEVQKAVLPLERVAFIASLVERKDYPVEMDNRMKGDRLLDALLGGVLLGGDKITARDAALPLMQSLSSNLAKKTYHLYLGLLLGEISDAEGVKEGEALFSARKKDRFFSGGDVIEGGGKENEIVVDFRLGAILKKIGSKSDSIHAWRW